MPPTLRTITVFCDASSCSLSFVISVSPYIRLCPKPKANIPSRKLAA
jgi:hypothetical protein